MSNEYKDPLIVSAIFFGVNSSWLDNWLRGMFPSMSDDPFTWSLIKTVIFAGLYYVYKRYAQPSSSDDKKALPSSGSGGK